MSNPGGGAGERKSAPFQQREFNEGEAQFSPSPEPGRPIGWLTPPMKRAVPKCMCESFPSMQRATSGLCRRREEPILDGGETARNCFSPRPTARSCLSRLRWAQGFAPASRKRSSGCPRVFVPTGTYRRRGTFSRADPAGRPGAADGMAGAAASRRFPPAPRLGSLHSLSLRRVAPEENAPIFGLHPTTSAWAERALQAQRFSDDSPQVRGHAVFDVDDTRVPR